MSTAGKIVLAANVLLLITNVMTVVHAQLPPEADSTGAPYLRVNINPTNVPPMVNINPNQSVPAVRVTEMPEIHMAVAGCENRRNFQTGVGRSIAGPLRLTYLHFPPQTRVTLADSAGSHSMNFGTASEIATAIFLESNQRLEFDSAVMYSGCRPD
jgi:hypothetical protein